MSTNLNIIECAVISHIKKFIIMQKVYIHMYMTASVEKPMTNVKRNCKQIKNLPDQFHLTDLILL